MRAQFLQWKQLNSLFGKVCCDDLTITFYWLVTSLCFYLFFFPKAQLENNETQTKEDKKENWDGWVYGQGSLNQQTADSNIVNKI